MKNLRASIDIGSNSTLLLIVDIDDNFNVLENHSIITGLGRGLDKTKKFSNEAIADTERALSQYKEICEKHGINTSDVIMTATEASRVATNATDFYLNIERELGLKVQIITGKGEAYYSTQGILFDQKIKDSEIVIMDIGGASTELIKVSTKNKSIIKSFSMPIGCVRIKNWLEEGTCETNINSVIKSFNDDLKGMMTQKLYCVAGTMTSVANMYLGHKDFIEPEVNGLEFKVTDVKALYNKHKNDSADKLLDYFPFLGKRSQTISAGLILSTKMMDLLSVEDLYVSTYGLRYGTLLAGKIENEYLA